MEETKKLRPHRVNSLIFKAIGLLEKKHTEVKRSIAEHLQVDVETVNLFLRSPKNTWRQAYLIALVDWFQKNGMADEVKSVEDLYEPEK